MSTKRKKPKRPLGVVTREQAVSMAEAHGEGWHSETRRDGCPECFGRTLGTYPTEAEVKKLRGLVVTWHCPHCGANAHSTIFACNECKRLRETNNLTI